MLKVTQLKGSRWDPNPELFLLHHSVFKGKQNSGCVHFTRKVHKISQVRRTIGKALGWYALLKALPW